MGAGAKKPLSESTTYVHIDILTQSLENHVHGYGQIYQLGGLAKLSGDSGDRRKIYICGQWTGACETVLE